jgi:hypothetical protein|tara:strand:+ start:12491 stop:12814 length:324 start_codon:yes stop_codon:yes gene_type:complete
MINANALKKLSFFSSSFSNKKTREALKSQVSITSDMSIEIARGDVSAKSDKAAVPPKKTGIDAPMPSDITKRKNVRFFMKCSSFISPHRLYLLICKKINQLSGMILV